MALVKDRRTGETVEVFNVARDDFVFAGPAGRPDQATLRHRSEFDPDPFLVVLRHGLVPWYDRVEA